MAARKSTETIYSTVLDRICLLEYPPHTRLGEVELAREFGTSRTPIRSVLLRLSLMGLVESRNGVGTFVTGMDYSAYVELYPMRLKIAELIGEFSPNDATPDDVRAVAQILKQARALRRKFDVRMYWDLNHRLHFTIGRLIGNRELRELWDRYYFQTARMWYCIADRDPYDTADAFVHEVEETLKAIRANDARAVGYAQRKYTAAAMEKIIKELDPETGDWIQEPPALADVR